MDFSFLILLIPILHLWAMNYYYSVPESQRHELGPALGIKWHRLSKLLGMIVSLWIFYILILVRKIPPPHLWLVAGNVLWCISLTILLAIYVWRHAMGLRSGIARHPDQTGPAVWKRRAYHSIHILSGLGLLALLACSITISTCSQGP